METFCSIKRDVIEFPVDQLSSALNIRHFLPVVINVIEQKLNCI